MEATIQKLMGMSDTVWQRHMNPWSVWTRIPCLPLLVLAIWSRAWIGGWALLPVLLVLVWIWMNPRVFPKPADWHNWASLGVIGERIWLNRRKSVLPAWYHRWPHIANGVSAFGAVPLIWGLAVLEPISTLIGLAVAVAGKLWFVDMMARLARQFPGRAAHYAPEG